MKLQKILSQLNSLEKNSFLKVIDNIISDNPKNKNDINKILLSYEGQLKNTDDSNIANIFGLIEHEFFKHVRDEFSNTGSQLDILIDILIRDGNCIMSREWFAKLYEHEIKSIRKKIAVFTKALEDESSEFEPNRIRDYNIYKECLKTAYHNDEANNQEAKITNDELTILNTLSKGLELSQEEVRLINYSILPLKKYDIEDIINDLKSLGIIFYHKKSYHIYIADEIVTILRIFRGKEVADKHFRRVLAHLKDGQINLIARRHNIDGKADRNVKVKEIIKNGISFSSVLGQEIYKSNSSQTDIKTYLNNLIFKELKIDTENKGKTAEEKINILKEYFSLIDKEQKIGISYHGYDKLLKDLNNCLSKLNVKVK